MIRTFKTHELRSIEELTGRVWDFTPLSGERAGERFPMVTPCCWENHPDFTNYRGEGVFTTRFEAEGTVRLVFEGVSHTATVTLDGVEVARHYNAYTPFDAVARNLTPGTHELCVKADNRFSEDSALHVPNDYMSYGGVSRPVALERLNSVFIRHIHVTPRRESGVWTAKIELFCSNVTDAPQSFAAEVHNAPPGGRRSGV